MYCFDVKSIVLIGMIMMWQIVTLSFLFDRRLYEKHRTLHSILLAVLIFWCLNALVFGGFVERAYAAISLISVTVIEVLVRRRRKLERALQ